MPQSPTDDIPIPSITNGPAFARGLLRAAAPEMVERLLAMPRDATISPTDRTLAATAALERGSAPPRRVTGRSSSEASDLTNGGVCSSFPHV